MRIVLTAILLLFVSQASFAQFFTIGPRVGVSSSQVKIDDVRNYDFKSTDNKLGFHAGVFSRISILGFYVQPEVLFTNNGGTIEVQQSAQGTANEIREYTYNKIDVPVMVGKMFAGIFRVNLGPTFSYLLSDEVNGSNAANQIQDVIENYNDATIGYQVGIGLDISKLIIDLKYEGNLSRLGNEISVYGESFNTDIRNTQLIVSIGLKLL